MSTRPVKVGVVGCGVISSQYFTGMQRFSILQTVACADLDVARAHARAEEFGIPKACSVSELLADPEIEMVINLTIPQAHAEVALAAIAAGKSVYNEKPLAVTREEGKLILEAAQAAGVLVGCAPDTFLGSAVQTCRKLIDDGAIGDPVVAAAFIMATGHECWHPDPEFYYKPGGGPMADLGPYHLIALHTLLGPVRRVSGATRTPFPERTITSQPKFGQKITVDVPTTVTGTLEYAGGAVCSVIASFDIFGGANLPEMEIYGTHGTLTCSSPGDFIGTVKLRRAGQSAFTEVPHAFENTITGGRGIGVADMAYALRSGRPHRASGALGYHILDIMEAFTDAGREGRYVELTSGVERPAPLPPGLPLGTLDE